VREADKIAVAALESLVSEELAQHFAERMLSRHHEPGTCVLEAGAGAHGLFVLVEGKLDLFVGTGERRVAVGSLSPVSFFGKAGFFDRGSSTTSFVAASPVHVLELALVDFEDLAEAQPGRAAELLRGLIALLAERLEDANARLLHQGTAEVDQSMISRLLARLLGGAR
jgi:CRP-like cAMP-binding protein